MATWTITYLTGDCEALSAASIRRDVEGHFVATNELGHPVAYLNATSIRSILRHDEGPQPVPVVIDEAKVRDRVRALLSEHDGRVATTLRRQFGWDGAQAGPALHARADESWTDTIPGRSGG
jgi:hypothetical protein